MTSGLLIPEMALLLAVAGLFGVLARVAKQPLILAYLATGALVGYLGFFNLIDTETFHLFADLGITMLLFLVGLEINYSSLKLVGLPSVVVGLGQIVVTGVLGYLIARGFAYSPLVSWYIGLALTFSSTVIIVQLLSDKKDLHSLYGKISVGMLLVQDAVTILALVLLAGINAGQGLSWFSMALVTLKGVLLFGLMLWLGWRVLPLLFDRVARSPQLLFMISTAWVLVMAAFVRQLGFSIEIGGFLAGVSLANSSEHYQIGSRMKSLRDFFIFAFFVLLGSSLTGFSFAGLGWPIIAFSLFVLIGNPLVVLVLMGAMGYRRRTSFLAAITSAQVSEFSLILVALGNKVGHLGQEIVALVTAVAVITILLSTYMVVYGEQIARRLNKFLGYFERRKPLENHIPEGGYHRPIVLVGAHRTGRAILAALPQEELLIIDADPDIARFYRREGYDVLLGSAADEDIAEAANLYQAKLVISTSPDFGDNKMLLEILRRERSRAKKVLRADNPREAELLYEAGADYVIFPHLSAGQFLGKHVAEHPDLAFLNIMRHNDLAALKRNYS